MSEPQQVQAVSMFIVTLFGGVIGFLWGRFYEKAVSHRRQMREIAELIKFKKLLLGAQVELDPVAKRALYENLWNLY